MIDLEKQASSMASANVQSTNSQVDGNVMCLAASSENMKIATSGVLNKKPLGSNSSPKQAHKNHEEKNGFVIPVIKESTGKDKPIHDSETAALGERHVANLGVKENAVLPVNSNCHKKDCDNTEEMRKVLANVEQDLNLKKINAKSPCIVFKNSNDKIESVVKMPAETKNICQSTKENTSIELKSVSLTNGVKSSLKAGLQEKETTDDMDDISIDLTEEEEEALLRPDSEGEVNSSSAADGNLEVGTKDLDISDSPQKDNQMAQESKMLISKELLGKEASALEIECVKVDNAAEVDSTPVVQNSDDATQEKMDVDLENAVVDCMNKAEGKDSNIQTDLPVVYDGNIEKEEESVSWKFSKDSLLNNRKALLNEIPQFENTAKEEGMQQAVDKVVQKILTDINPDGDSNDCLSPLPSSCSKSDINASSVTLSDDKKMFDDDDDDELESELTSSKKDMIIKHLLTTDLPSDNTDTSKDSKELTSTGSMIKIASQTETLTIPEKASFKEEISELKRKLTCIEDDKQIEKLGLTVKKVKLDSESRKEDIRAVEARSILLSRLRPAGDTIAKRDKICNKLSKQELEDLTTRMITLYLTENDQSEISMLKAKCEKLEKALADCKRKNNCAQKQMLELNIAIQRAVHQRKERPGGPGPITKVTTRTVGLQVQMQSFLIPDEKTPARSQGPPNNRPLPSTSTDASVALTVPNRFQSQRAAHPGTPRMPASVKPSNPGLTLPPGAVATRVVNPQGKTGVSILQPRVIGSQQSIAPAPPIGVPKVASVTAPSSAALRPIRMQGDVKHLNGTENNQVAQNKFGTENMKSELEIQLASCQYSTNETTDGQNQVGNRILLNIDVSQNSHKMTKASVRIVQGFLLSFHEMRELNALPPSLLDKYLSSFFSTAKKKNGFYYTSHTLKCIYDGIDRFLRSHLYPSSLKKDEVFSSARESLRQKCNDLKAENSPKEVSQDHPLVESETAAHSNLTQSDVEHHDGISEESLDSSSISLSPTAPTGKDLQLEKLLSKYTNSSEHSIQVIKLDSCTQNQTDAGSSCMYTNQHSQLKLPGNGTCSYMEISQNNARGNSYLTLRTDTELSSSVNESHNGSRAYGIPNSVSKFLQWLQVSVQHETHPLHDIPSEVLDGYIAAYIESKRENCIINDLWSTAKTFWDELCSYLCYFNYFCNLDISSEFPKTLELLMSLRYYVDVAEVAVQDTNGRSQSLTGSEDREKLSKEIMNDVQLFTDWLSSPPFNDQTQLLDISSAVLDDHLLRFLNERNDDSCAGLQLVAHMFANLLKYLIFNKYSEFDRNSNCLPKTTEHIRRIQQHLDASALAEMDFQDHENDDILNSGSCISPLAENLLTLSSSDLTVAATVRSADENCGSEFSDCNENSYLSTLLEPDISLIEDDNELELKEESKIDIDNVASCDQEFQLQLLKRFLKCGINEHRELHELPPDQLNAYLERFYSVVASGSSSTLNLSTFQLNLNNHLKHQVYPWSLVNNDLFEGSRRRLQECLNTVHNADKKDDRIEQLYRNNILSNSCPISLLCTLWYYIKKTFYVLSCEEHASLLWCDFRLRTENGTEYLEYCKFSNLVSGMSPLVSADVIFTTAYKTYRQTRSVNTCNPTSKFYLRMAATRQFGIWFSDMPMGTKQLEVLQGYSTDITQIIDTANADRSREKWYAELMKLVVDSTCFNANKQSESSKSVTSLKQGGSLNGVLMEDKSASGNKNTLATQILRKLSCDMKISSISSLKPEKQHCSSNQQNNISIEDEALKSEFSSLGSAPNTISKTLHDVNLFRDWLAANKKDPKIHEMSPSVLGQYLLQFLKTVRKPDGTDYLPNSLRAMLFSIDRYLKLKKYKSSIKADPSFLACQKMIQERSRRQRAKIPDLVFRHEDIRFLYSRHSIGPWSPQAMLMALWYVNSKLGVVNRDHFHLKWGEVALKRNQDGAEYLEYQLGGSEASTHLKAFAIPGSPTECPVELFKTYRLRRPSSLCQMDSCFYLFPNQDTLSQTWFLEVPLSQSKLANIPLMIQDLIRKAKRQSNDAVCPAGTQRILEPKHEFGLRVEDKVISNSAPLVTLTSLKIQVPNTNMCSSSATSSSTFCGAPSISLIPLSQCCDKIFPHVDASGKVDGLMTYSPASTDHIVMFPISSSGSASFSSRSTSSNSGVQIIPLP